MNAIGINTIADLIENCEIAHEDELPSYRPIPSQVRKKILPRNVKYLIPVPTLQSPVVRWSAPAEDELSGDVAMTLRDFVAMFVPNVSDQPWEALRISYDAWEGLELPPLNAMHNLLRADCTLHERSRKLPSEYWLITSEQWAEVLRYFAAKGRDSHEGATRAWIHATCPPPAPKEPPWWRKWF